MAADAGSSTAALTSHFDRLGEGILIVDHEWRVVYVNAEAGRLVRHTWGGAPLTPGVVLWDRVPVLAGSAMAAAIRRAADEQVACLREVGVADGTGGLEVRIDPSADGVVLLLRDISERWAPAQRERRLEEELATLAAAKAANEESIRLFEERFRALVESVDDVVFRLDREQRCVMIFGRWLQREGLRPEWFLGRTSREIAGMNDPDAHEAANRRALAGESFVYDWTLQSRHGLRHMQTSLAPVRGSDGAVIGIVGVGRDITARVTAEQEIQRLNTDLQRRAEQQRFLAEASRTLASSLDYAATLAGVARLAVPRLADYCIVDLVDADGGAVRVEFAHVDRDKEQRLAHVVRRYPPVPDWPAHPISEVLRTGEPALLPEISADAREAMARSPEQRAYLQELAPVSMMALPLRAHERTLGVLSFGYAESRRTYGPDDLGLARELADRAALAVENAQLYRAAQIELAERRRVEDHLSRWASIFEHAGWGVAISSPSGDRIEAVNPAYARMHGYPPEALIGRPVEELYAPAARAALPRHYQAALEQGHYTYESVHLRADGTEFPVLVDVTVVRDAAGRPLYRAANIQDITERRRAEEQLRQAQKMDAVGRLAGGVAHDFNNMLMIIMGFSDFLATSLEPDDPRRADAEEIRHAADRAAVLTRQLLAFGRQQVLQREVVDLNAVVTGFERMLRPILGEAIQLVIRLSPRLGGVVADQGQLEQVLTNLVLNARDAMPGGGRLEIETYDREFAEGEAYREVGIDLPPGPYVMLTVSDSGQGMDAAVRSRLFEPFFTTKSASQNSGLGLATVYGIVTQFGGSIWVDSEPGRGSRFTVCLPRAGESPRTDAPVAVDVPRGGSETLLLVEDEDAVRSLTSRVLTDQGYRIVEAANGREALEAFVRSGNTVDLVVTDIVMPEMGGPELAERVREIRPGTPVVFISGYSEGERPGAAAPLLEKPFSPDRLIRWVRQALDAAGRPR